MSLIWVKKLKRLDLLPAAAFALTAAVLSLIYAVAGLYPFGGRTLAWGDMSQQVVPLLMELKDILEGKAGMFLNLQNAGGMSFWGVFFFFLASPLHFLVAFVEKPEVYQLVNLLVWGKLSLAAASSSCFFRHEAPRLSFPAQLALSTSYGLCGYGMLYYQNLVWLDALILFPLLMLGFVRLLGDGRSVLFTAMLTITVAVNYYLSYMVLLCLILCGGIFFRLCLPKEERGKAAGRLGVSTAAALALTAVVWLPSLLQCLASARTGGGVVESIQSGGFWTKLSTTLPVLLCTVGAAALPILYRLFPHDPKERAVAACWGLTVIPLLIEPVNKLWHTGSYQAFPARYGYMPVLFGLWFLALGLHSPREEKQEHRPQRWRTLCGMLLLPVAAGCYLLLGPYEAVSGYTHTLWISPEAIGLLSLLWVPCLALLLAVCFNLHQGGGRKIAGGILLGFCLVQGSVQAGIFIGSAANIPTNSLAVLAAEPPQDEGLYRVKPARKFCHINLLGAAGYPSLNHYTSLTDSRYLAMIKKLGYSAYWMETSACCGTQISDVLLSNKYVLEADLSWSPAAGGNLGYLVPAGALPEELPLGDRIAAQNQLYRALTGEDAFTPHTPVRGGIREEEGGFYVEPGVLRYEVDVTEPVRLYFDAFDCISTRLREKINDGFSVAVNGQAVMDSYPTQSCNGILDLGSYQNERVTVEVTIQKEMGLCSLGLWSLDASAPQKLAGALADVDLRWERGKLEGRAQADHGQSLFLSIPRYKGMAVRVDGEEVEPRVVLDCLMEIPLPEGESKFTVSYIPAGLLPGLLITLGGAGMVLLVFLFRRTELICRTRQVWEGIAPALLKAAWLAELLAVYLLPSLIWMLGQR